MPQEVEYLGNVQSSEALMLDWYLLHKNIQSQRLKDYFHQQGIPGSKVTVQDILYQANCTLVSSCSINSTGCSQYSKSFVVVVFDLMQQSNLHQTVDLCAAIASRRECRRWLVLWNYQKERWRRTGGWEEGRRREEGRRDGRWWKGGDEGQEMYFFCRLNVQWNPA